MSELNNKVAVITGAGSGIGEAIAKALSQHGVNIALAGRNEEKLQIVAQQLETETKVIPTDVTQKIVLTKCYKSLKDTMAKSTSLLIALDKVYHLKSQIMTLNNGTQ